MEAASDTVADKEQKYCVAFIDLEYWARKAENERSP